MLLLAGLVLVACSGPQPVQVAAGDLCFRCRKIIVEPRHAAEIVDQDGRAYKFRTVGCMAKFIKANPTQEFKAIFATDFSTGRMVKVSAVKFVPQMMGEGPQRTLDYVAYYADAGAQEAAQRNNTTPVDWAKVLADTVP